MLAQPQQLLFTTGTTKHIGITLALPAGVSEVIYDRNNCKKPYAALQPRPGLCFD